MRVSFFDRIFLKKEGGGAMKRSERLSAKDRRLLKETLKELNRQGRLQEEKLAKQHGSTSVYQHSINVAT